MQKFLSENLYPANGGIASRITHAVGGVLNFPVKFIYKF